MFEEQFDDLTKFLRDVKIRSNPDWHIFVELNDYNTGKISNSTVSYGVCQSKDGELKHTIETYNFDDTIQFRESAPFNTIIQILEPTFDDIEKTIRDAANNFWIRLALKANFIIIGSVIISITKKLPIEHKDAFPKEVRMYIDKSEELYAIQRDLISDRQYMTDFYFANKKISKLSNIDVSLDKIANRLRISG